MESRENKKKFDIVCLSTQLWEDPLWTNKQHVMSRLAKRGHRILYVDPLIRVRKFLKHVAFGRYSPKRFLTFVKKISENLWLYSPVKFLFSEEREKKFNLDRINRLIGSLGLDSPVLWVYDPEFSEYPQDINHRLLVYDCVDDYANFPEGRYPQGKEWILKKEEKLVREADVVFTTAKHLYEQKKKLNENTYYTPNAAEFDHNKKALDPNLEVPEEVKNIPKPIIGFQGALAEYKIDLELLEETASEKPDWSFVLIGPKAPVDPSTDLSKLESMDNVFFLGRKQYEDLPKYYKAMDTAIMPSALNDYTRSSFPLKFFEFLGAGLPVVATRLPALKDYWDADYVYFSDSVEEFIENIEKALKERDESLVQKRLKAAKNNSWDAKVDKMVEIINSHLSNE